MQLNPFFLLKIPPQLDVFQIEISNVNLKPLFMEKNSLILDMSPQIVTFWHFQTDSFPTQKMKMNVSKISYCLVKRNVSIATWWKNQACRYG